MFIALILIAAFLYVFWKLAKMELDIKKTAKENNILGLESPESTESHNKLTDLVFSENYKPLKFKRREYKDYNHEKHASLINFLNPHVISAIIIVAMAIISISYLTPNSSINSQPENNAANATTENNPSESSTNSTVEREYLASMTLYLNNIKENMSKLQYLINNPNITDDVWLYNVGFIMGIIQINCRNIKILLPPDKFIVPHSYMYQAADSYIKGTENIAYGLDNSNSSSLDTAKLFLNDGLDYVTKGYEEYSKIENSIK